MNAVNHLLPPIHVGCLSEHSEDAPDLHGCLTDIFSSIFHCILFHRALGSVYVDTNTCKLLHHVRYPRLVDRGVKQTLKKHVSDVVKHVEDCIHYEREVAQKSVFGGSGIRLAEEKNKASSSLMSKWWSGGTGSSAAASGGGGDDASSSASTPRKERSTCVINVEMKFQTQFKDGFFSSTEVPFEVWTVSVAMMLDQVLRVNETSFQTKRALLRIMELAHVHVNHLPLRKLGLSGKNRGNAEAAGSSTQSSDADHESEEMTYGEIDSTGTNSDRGYATTNYFAFQIGIKKNAKQRKQSISSGVFSTLKSFLSGPQLFGASQGGR